MHSCFWEEHIVLGFFPFPAGLLIGPVTSADAWLSPVKKQGIWPEEVPESWAFYAFVLQGQIEEALQHLEGEVWWKQFNRMVLTEDKEAYQELMEEEDDERRTLLQSVGYVLGFEESLSVPEATSSWFEWMIWGHFLVDHGEGVAALQAMDEALSHVPEDFGALHAYLEGLKALIGFRVQGVEPALIPQLQKALKALQDTALEALKAELWMTLGMAYQELAQGRRGALLEAVKCYHQALQYYSKSTHPEVYALLQNNLALAYLAMPIQESRDQLRKAIAVQALREALKVYTREAYPEAWASATLNLANALQHLPSSDLEKHLWQAVALYQELLDVRKPDRDPAGYARVLANQANALAHLGAFSRALPRYEEALKYFEEIGELDSVQVIQQAIEEIHYLQSKNGTTPTTTV